VLNWLALTAFARVSTFLRFTESALAESPQSETHALVIAGAVIVTTFFALTALAILFSHFILGVNSESAIHWLKRTIDLDFIVPLRHAYFIGV
jgi:hypothetical protein